MSIEEHIAGLIRSGVRLTATNLQHEPPTGYMDEVVFSLRDPEMTVHFEHPDCCRDDPHPIAECGVWHPP